MAQPPGATVLLHCTAPATATSPLPAGGPVRSRMRRITEQHSNANRRSWLGWRRWLVKGKNGVGIRLAHVAKDTLRPSVLGLDSNYACLASYEAKPTRVSEADKSFGSCLLTSSLDGPNMHLRSARNWP